MCFFTLLFKIFNSLMYSYITYICTYNIYTHIQCYSSHYGYIFYAVLSNIFFLQFCSDRNFSQCILHAWRPHYDLAQECKGSNMSCLGPIQLKITQDTIMVWKRGCAKLTDLKYKHHVVLCVKLGQILQSLFLILSRKCESFYRIQRACKRLWHLSCMVLIQV